MATVVFYLKELSSGEASVMLRFTIDRGARFKLATGERIAAQFWDSTRQQAKSKFPDHLLFNQSLNKIKGDIIQLYRDNKGKSISELQDLARPLVKFGQTSSPEKKSIFPIYWKFVEQVRLDKDKKTTQKYEALYARRRGAGGKIIETGALFEFSPRLQINQLDLNFYDAFKNWLFDRGLLDSTVYKYFTNLSTFLTWADARGNEVHHTKGKPTHKSWEIIRRSNDPITLTEAELSKLFNLEITEDLIDEKIPAEKHGRHGERTVRALTLARDYFLLECLTGQRISDIKKFSVSDVQWPFWVNTVKKGNRLQVKKIRIPLNTKFTQPAWEILSKYNFTLPVISEQKINANIKTLCRLAGITDDLTVTRWQRGRQVSETREKCDWITTHTGRRTFITITLQYMTGKRVKDIAGISFKTLKHYEGHSEDQNLIEGLNSIPATFMKVG